jgi:hypothetical protein
MGRERSTKLKIVGVPLGFELNQPIRARADAGAPCLELDEEWPAADARADTLTTTIGELANRAGSVGAVVVDEALILKFIATVNML